MIIIISPALLLIPAVAYVIKSKWDVLSVFSNVKIIWLDSLIVGGLAQVPSLFKNRSNCPIWGAGTKPGNPEDSSVGPIKINSFKVLFIHAPEVVSYTKKESSVINSLNNTSFKSDKNFIPESSSPGTEPAISFVPRYKIPVDSSSS